MADTCRDAVLEAFNRLLERSDRREFQLSEIVAEVTAQARNNEFENFRLVFDRMFMSTVVGRMDDNDEIFRQILDDDDFKQTLMDLYPTRVCLRLREGNGSTTDEWPLPAASLQSTRPIIRLGNRVPGAVNSILVWDEETQFNY